VKRSRWARPARPPRGRRPREIILTACRHGANRSGLLTAFNYLRGRSRNGWLEQLINELLPAVISTRTLGTGSAAGRIDTVNLAHDR